MWHAAGTAKHTKKPRELALARLVYLRADGSAVG